MTSVKVTLNRASLRLDEQLARQVMGKTQNRQKLIRAFNRSGVVERWRALLEHKLEETHDAILAVFRGEVTGIDSPVTSVGGVQLGKPWAPLSEQYRKRKKTDAYWFETGSLLQYVANAMQPLSQGSVKKVEVTAQKVPRGARTMEVRTLITPVRLPEPLQSMVMYPFLQGKGNDLTSMGSSDTEVLKLLVNHALRGFLPDIAAEYGKKLLVEIKS